MQGRDIWEWKRQSMHPAELLQFMNLGSGRLGSGPPARYHPFLLPRLQLGTPPERKYVLIQQVNTWYQGGGWHDSRRNSSSDGVMWADDVLPLGRFSEDQEHPWCGGSQTSTYRETLPSATSGNNPLKMQTLVHNYHANTRTTWTI